MIQTGTNASLDGGWLLAESHAREKRAKLALEVEVRKPTRASTIHPRMSFLTSPFPSLQSEDLWHSS